MAEIRGSGNVSPAVVETGNLGANYTLDVDGRSVVWLIGTLNANLTLTLSNLAAGSHVRLFLTQDGTGSRTVSITGLGSVTVDSTASALTELDVSSPNGSSILLAGSTPTLAETAPFMSGVIHPPGFPPTMVQANTTLTAQRTYFCRVVSPKAGYVRDLSIFQGTQSGNVEVSIWTPASTRAKLWSSGSVACPAAGAWRIIGDPGTNVPVSVGTVLEFGFTADNATASFGRTTNPSVGDMPSTFWPTSGSTPKAFARGDIGNVGSMPSTIAEASLITSALSALIIIGRVA